MSHDYAIITHPIYREHETGGHPECSDRLRVIERAICEDSELMAVCDRIEPGLATRDDVLRCHTEAHIALLAAARGKEGYFDPDTIHSPESVDAAYRAAGAAIHAVKAVVEGDTKAAFALVRPPGHHACPDRAMGFCMINNVAVAARYARSVGLERVLIVDFDVHHGNGTQDIFYEDGSVFFYSLHAHPHYPGTGMEHETGSGEGVGTTLNRPLRHGFPADDYREVYVRDLDAIVNRFEPQLAIISAGFDSHRKDPLGGLSLESPDFWTLTEAVRSRMPPGRVVGSLEGGYNLDELGGAVRQHLRALFGLPMGDDQDGNP